MRTIAAVAGFAVLCFAAPAGAQVLALLDVSSGMPVAPDHVQVPLAPRGPDAYSITMLARVIAGEAGGDSFSSLTAKKAVGAAIVNEIQKRYGIEKVTQVEIHRLLKDQPGYLSSLHDHNRYLYFKDAAWFRAHGYAGCLTAAKAVLQGEDPSHGATNWYDTSIRQPYGSNVIAVTGHVRTAGSTIVFYRFR